MFFIAAGQHLSRATNSANLLSPASLRHANKTPTDNPSARHYSASTHHPSLFTALHSTHCKLLRRAMHQSAFAHANEGGRERSGGGRHRETVGGAGGVLYPRARHRPPAVLVRARGVSRPVLRRRASGRGLGGRSTGGRVPGYVQGCHPGRAELLASVRPRRSSPAARTWEAFIGDLLQRRVPRPSPPNTDACGC
jgi:hypothetical protein